MTELIKFQNSIEDLTASMKQHWLEIVAAESKFNVEINRRKIAFGENLRAAKLQLQYGQWQDWLAENFAMTDRTARNYMQVAEYFGGNSTLKTEYVFRFSFYALIELTRIDRQEVEKFLETYKEKGVNLSTLSVRQLKTAIKDWKETLTVDVQAEISTAPVIDNAPNLPPPSFDTIPNDLIAAAAVAGLKIELNFSRAFKLPPADTVLITRQNDSPQFRYYLKTAACVIVTPPIVFIRSDYSARKVKVYVWFFGSDTENFVNHFDNFGGAMYTQKTPAPLF